VGFLIFLLFFLLCLESKTLTDVVVASNGAFFSFCVFLKASKNDLLERQFFFERKEMRVLESFVFGLERKRETGRGFWAFLLLLKECVF